MVETAIAPMGGEKGARPKSRIVQTLVLIAGIWILSDLGYYYLLPTFGQKLSYNDGPVGAALYYFFWSGVAVIMFWPLYETWPRYAGWGTFENRVRSIAIWSFLFACGVLFAGYVLPSLPPFSFRDGLNPPELPLASPWYFLPKSIDILFQQLLVVALVLALSAAKYSLRKISILCATLFGGVHILLAFADVPWGYVARFATLATIFGFMFPYFILRVPNGFAYSYLMHWGYYALTIIVARIVASGALGEFVGASFGAR